MSRDHATHGGVIANLGTPWQDSKTCALVAALPIAPRPENVDVKNRVHNSLNLIYSVGTQVVALKQVQGSDGKAPQPTPSEVNLTATVLGQSPVHKQPQLT